MHALSGCDTTSYPVGKGKVSALKAMRVVPDKLLHCIREAEATDLQITKATRAFFLALYNQRNSVTLDATRYEIYRKRNSPPAMKTLPATERNMRFHGRRASQQVLLWKAADKPDPPAVDITLFGWNKKMGLKEGEELIMPTQDSSQVPPPAFLAAVSLGCKAGLKPCTSAK